MDAVFLLCACREIKRHGSLRSEAAAEGDSNPKYVVGVKLEVVGDVVPMGFGTYEEAPPDRVANAHSSVKKKMVAVKSIVAATGWDGAPTELIVEDQGLAADAGHEIAAGFARQLARKNAVDVIEDRAIRLKVVVVRLMVAKRPFHIQPEVIVENVFGAGARINATLYGWGQKSHGCRGILRRPESVAADSDIHFLGTSKSD